MHTGAAMYGELVSRKWPLRNVPVGSETMVLASGGLDSSTLLALLADHGVQPTSLFVHYGQRAAIAEEAAVTSICRTMGVPLRIVRYEGGRFEAGEIRGRNAFLLHTALLESKQTSGMILMGIHDGTRYVDCGSDFIEVMQRSFDLHTGGSITIVTPFLTWSKSDVWHLALELGVPVAQTYSCEADNRPCGRCDSCIDRKSLRLEQSCASP